MSDLWKVQTTKRPTQKSGYETRYSFESKHKAMFYYVGINIGNGYKKRLVAPDGKVVLRDTSW